MKESTITPISLQWFNPETGRWEEEEMPEVGQVIQEIERIEAMGAIGSDYKSALITIVNQVTDQRLNNIQIEAN